MSFLYRLLTIMWALFAKLTGGKLPDGVQFVPSSPAQPSPPPASSASEPSPIGATGSVPQPSSESKSTDKPATGQPTAGATRLDGQTDGR